MPEKKHEILSEVTEIFIDHIIRELEEGGILVGLGQCYNIEVDKDTFRSALVDAVANFDH